MAGLGEAGFPKLLLAATLVVPAAVGLRYLVHTPPLALFLVGGIAIAVLAEWMRRATEQLAVHAGPAIGGLLTVSFGSAAELILALFVILEGHADVVRAQITGSILGTTLLGLGLACFAGGMGREAQHFERPRAQLQSSMLLIVTLALLLPAIFDRVEIARATSAAERFLGEAHLSVGVSVVLLLLYGGYLVFTLVTHRDVFSRSEAAEGDGEANAAAEAPEKAVWSPAVAVAILVVATVAVAGCAEFVSTALQASASTLGLPLLFLGVVPLALIGTAADLFAAVGFARQDKMGLVMSICVGSAIQVGLVIAPLLVLISWVLGRPMSLVFPSILDLFAIAGAVFVVRSIAADGETNWFEGLMLIAVYVLFALAFLFVASPA
ncbi:MAG: calcium/proton exchanger [Bosea sp.]|nr:calcium/proton exchanger [Bosea sp. (in: a-proteobacteria)]